GVPAREIRNHAFVRNLIGLSSTIARLVLDGDLAPLQSVQDDVTRVFIDRVERLLGSESIKTRKCVELRCVPRVLFASCAHPWRDGALIECEPRVWNDEIGIELELDSESRTIRTGTLRRIERKIARFDLAQADA